MDRIFLSAVNGKRFMGRKINKIAMDKRRILFIQPDCHGDYLDCVDLKKAQNELLLGLALYTKDVNLKFSIQELTLVFLN